jgi:hypothetical protein
LAGRSAPNWYQKHNAWNHLTGRRVKQASKRYEQCRPAAARGTLETPSSRESSVYRCVRPQCPRPALAAWWQLCAECSRPLLDLAGPDTPSSSDQRLAAGWDALDWTQRISSDCWGSAVEDDPWVLSVRCLAMASVVTGRSSGCAHTVDATVAVPVVAVARAPGVLRCPPCAEPVVAQTSSSGAPCDRCRSSTVDTTDRTAALTGSSLIIVGQLCRPCRGQVIELLDGAEPA